MFAPARSLDYARDDEAKEHSERSAGGRGRPPLPVLPKVSTGIADLPTAARRFVTILKVSHSGSAFSPLEKSKIQFFSLLKK